MECHLIFFSPNYNPVLTKGETRGDVLDFFLDETKIALWIMPM